MADDRDDVLSRIKPVGTVAIEGQPAPAAAPAPVAAAPAATTAPAAAPVAAPAPAAGGSEGATLYAAKGCAGCHGADGKTTIMPVYPTLAGQTSAYLVAQMKDIKNGARNNGQSIIMKGIIAGVSDAEIETIADWLSNQ
ncbi:MAG: cytochrome C [endosymbiont of Escarpia spicata]|uniref:Cytochrome C n=1 Tax=endosymbiont of Escarpia spicata TaxID=2200908 RepID=A0A370DBI4_9GAMM|nr:MAG: cytochrome C [endosymbiont of Escarpia spicata]